jgi:hypothetical protein
MVRLAAGLVGTYFVAFAATSFVVAGSDATPISAPAPLAVKTDRLDPIGSGIAQPRRVAEVELIGADAVAVVLRDDAGREVMRVDHASNTTVVARDVLIPQLRLHAEIQQIPLPPPREVPVPATLPQETGDEAEEQIFACESGMSALADRQAASLPRICLAALPTEGEKYSLAASF